MIHILSTGGTFEKIYGSGMEVQNYSFPQKSMLLRMKNLLGIRDINIVYHSEQAKDSLDMDDTDRMFVANWCQNCTGDRCIIIHGTDTMIDTASIINQVVTNKTIILTGSLQPAFARDTDAEMNFGGALIAAQTCKYGIYIVMSGQVFHWNACQKDPISGTFRSVKRSDS